MSGISQPDDIDPLQSPALRKEFPGLETAFDGAAAKEYLQDALFDRNRQRYTVCTCEPVTAIYVPGDCCIVRYEVEIEDRASGQKSLCPVTGRIFPNAQLCDA